MRRFLPDSEAPDVLAALHANLDLIEIVAPSAGGQPLMLWFGRNADTEPLAAYVADGVVDLHYLLIDTDLWPSYRADLLTDLDLATVEEWLGEARDDPSDAADVAVVLGVIAPIPWDARVESVIAELEKHPEPGVQASARLAREYAATLT